MYFKRSILQCTLLKIYIQVINILWFIKKLCWSFLCLDPLLTNYIYHFQETFRVLQARRMTSAVRPLFSHISLIKINCLARTGLHFVKPDPLQLKCLASNERARKPHRRPIRKFKNLKTGHPSQSESFPPSRTLVGWAVIEGGTNSERGPVF